MATFRIITALLFKFKIINYDQQKEGKSLGKKSENTAETFIKLLNVKSFVGVLCAVPDNGIIGNKVGCQSEDCTHNKAAYKQLQT